MRGGIEFLRMSRDLRWQRSKFMKGNRITGGNYFVLLQYKHQRHTFWKITEHGITLSAAPCRHKNKRINVVIVFGYNSKHLNRKVIKTMLLQNAR